MAETLFNYLEAAFLAVVLVGSMLVFWAHWIVKTRHPDVWVDIRPPRGRERNIRSDWVSAGWWFRRKFKDLGDHTLTIVGHAMIMFFWLAVLIWVATAAVLAVSWSR